MRRLNLSLSETESKEVVLRVGIQHQNKWIEKAQEISKNQEDFSIAQDFLKFENDLIVEATNLNSEEAKRIQDFDLEEWNKLKTSFREVIMPFEKKN